MGMCLLHHPRAKVRSTSSHQRPASPFDGWPDRFRP
jgi:hypothetical protein